MTNSTLKIDWGFISESRNAEQLNYNDLRSHYSKLATEAENDYKNNYDLRFTNLQQLLQNTPDVAAGYIKGAIEEAVKKLVERGIYDVDPNHFAAQYWKKYDEWTPAYEKVVEEYARIALNATQLDAYRTARRENSGQVMGGGFGLEGAMKGMAVAGAASLAIGAVHGLFNMAAKGISAAGDVAKQVKILTSNETKSSLVSSIRQSVYNVHFALLDALKDRQQNTLGFEKVSEANKDKASRMLGNLQGNLVAEDDVENILKQVLKLDPYNIDAYGFAIARYGDGDKSIEKQASIMCMDVNEEKRKLISKLYEDGTEEAANKSINAIEIEGARIGYSVEMDYVAQLKIKSVQYDIAARTFKGKLHESRKGAADASIQYNIRKRKNSENAVKTIKKTLQVAFKIVAFGVVAVVLLLVLGELFLFKKFDQLKVEKANEQKLAQIKLKANQVPMHLIIPIENTTRAAEIKIDFVLTDESEAIAFAKNLDPVRALVKEIVLERVDSLIASVNYKNDVEEVVIWQDAEDKLATEILEKLKIKGELSISKVMVTSFMVQKHN